jgi:hypothetical protein
MPKMMFKTHRAGIPSQAVRALFVQFCAHGWSKEHIVYQVNVGLNTIYCLMNSIIFFVREVVFSRGSKL